MLPETIIKRLMLSRYFLRLADDNSRSDREAAIFGAINLLQDSVEFFLIAAAEHLNAGVKERSNFEAYLDKVDERIAPEKLPFRPKLLQLNKVRVNAKHYGVRPDASEVKSLILVVREFFEEVAQTAFKVDFWTVSLLSLLDDGETKDALLAAEKAFEAKNYSAVLIECRKAFYLEFERAYDIKTFEDRDAGSSDVLFGWTSSAPWFARNKQYVEKHVRDPFDFIVLDHDRIERELASDRIDHSAFWNIWRLTPQVYQPAPRSIADLQSPAKWNVKNDCAKLDPDGIEQRASYVLENTIDIVLTKQLRRRATRYMRNRTDYVVTLRREEVPLHGSADRTSEVVSTTPKGLRELIVDYSCEGLKGDGTYWHVTHWSGEISDPQAVRLWGYLHADEVAT